MVLCSTAHLRVGLLYGWHLNSCNKVLYLPATRCHRAIALRVPCRVPQMIWHSVWYLPATRRSVASSRTRYHMLCVYELITPLGLVGAYSQYACVLRNMIDMTRCPWYRCDSRWFFQATAGSVTRHVVTSMVVVWQHVSC